MPSFSGKYWFIEVALARHRHVFEALESRMDHFEALPLSAFQTEWNRLWDQYRPINPHQTDEELKTFVNAQIGGLYSPRSQFAKEFWDAFEIQSVIITMLSHALIEGLINAIVAFMLVKLGKPKLFAVLERASVKEKWLIFPTLFITNYAFDKSGSLYEALNALCEERNNSIHPKITIRDDEQHTVIEGTEKSKITFDINGRRWIKRFLTLPYQLHSHLVDQVEDQSIKFFLTHMLHGTENSPPLALWGTTPADFLGQRE